MKTAIIGAGAMGSLFGGMLSKSGAEVWLLDIWGDHIRAVQSGGLLIEKSGGSEVVPVRATLNAADIGAVELAIVFVKSIQTEQAAVTAKNLVGNRGGILTLQNGMGNADVLAEIVGPDRVIAGTTSHGATMLGPGKIRHAGVGATTIGWWHSGDGDLVGRIAAYFTRAGIQTEVVNDVKRIVWEKLLVNIGINAITALTGIKNGQLLDLQDTRDLSKSAVEEAVRLAETLGVTVRNDAVDHVYRVAEATAANRSSMGQDIDGRRQTEIDTINGFIVREAERLGLQAPVNKTLTALVRTIQAHY